jgi:hypothetical protein
MQCLKILTHKTQNEQNVEILNKGKISNGNLPSHIGSYGNR